MAEEKLSKGEALTFPIKSFMQIWLNVPLPNDSSTKASLVGKDYLRSERYAHRNNI
jgi:hypothetical protein